MKLNFFLIFTFVLLFFFISLLGCPVSSNNDGGNNSNNNNNETNDTNVLFIPTQPPLGYPNSSNTGLTDPSLLSTDLSSLNKVSLGWEATDGQTVENLEIRGRLILNGDNITVRNCRIWGDKPDENGFAKGYGIQIFPDPVKDINIVIENSEIGQDENTWPNHILGIITSIRDIVTVNITIRNNYFRYLHDGMFFGSTNSPQIEVTIEDNYFVYIWAEDGVPGDSIHDHKGDGIESNGPLYNSVIQHNSIDVPTSQTSCILLQSNWDNLDNILIHNNWLNGAGYSLKVRTRYDTPYNFTNVNITDNIFGRDYGHGPFDAYDFDPADLAGRVSGNKWADTLELITEMNQ